MSYFRTVLEMAELKNIRALEKMAFQMTLQCVMMMVVMLLCMQFSSIQPMDGAPLTWIFGLMGIGSVVALYFTSKNDAKVARARADAVVDDALFKANVKAEVQSMTDTNNLIGGV